ncbi:ribosome hibernation-promoting factor, HPF/YfiA family [Vitiosangium sp. GDMCC 1.1324]|uniref:ribosome hibernation-promoting factor, HPF/YfiA family n=1 Tax=Vitiosangium sp. (strain GDMCC 1.1324) TaxID=2138576 RepID=UPI000D38007E|nr:ribosome-associated translation inhibitor RaiA [Vitiosangium sp. GDMCC 1.1324]PTL76389.1 ribosome-associated translation inhibitor RaiA [Vitiosangium sp. GDMCC 1.1324]
MQLNITFRQFGSSDALKEYAKEKVERVNKYLDRAGEAHVVLSLERHLHHAEITIHSGSWVLRGREKSEDMYASIDLAMDKIEAQLRKYKEKIKNHHGRERVHHRQGLVNNLKVRHKVFELPEELLDEAAEAPAAQPLSAPAAAQPGTRIVRTSEITVKPMSVDEAVMQMNLMNQDFYVFQHESTHEVCVVYRRKDDGQYGLIGVHAPPTAG